VTSSVTVLEPPPPPPATPYICACRLNVSWLPIAITRMFVRTSSTSQSVGTPPPTWLSAWPIMAPIPAWGFCGSNSGTSAGSAGRR
jgi:hypothetical protein